MFLTIDASISSIPMPAFALASTASSAGMASSSSSSDFTFGMSAFGRSILFMTGTSFKLRVFAIWALAIVCASMPCEASITSRAPSDAISDLETS